MAIEIIAGMLAAGVALGYVTSLLWHKRLVLAGAAAANALMALLMVPAPASMGPAPQLPVAQQFRVILDNGKFEVVFNVVNGRLATRLVRVA